MNSDAVIFIIIILIIDVKQFPSRYTIFISYYTKAETLVFSKVHSFYNFQLKIQKFAFFFFFT